MKFSVRMKWVFIGAAALLVGCDNTIPYVSTLPLPEKGVTKVAVATVDERPDVVLKQNPPSYVGIWRAAFGNPWNFQTGDHRPLADDFSTTIVNSLVGSGFQAAAVTTQPAADAAEALKLLSQSTAERRMLVEIRKWDSDTYVNPTVHYDVTLHVYDSNGKELVSKTDTKDQELKGTPLAYLNNMPKVVEEFYEQKMTEWLSDPGIQAAL